MFRKSFLRTRLRAAAIASTVLLLSAAAFLSAPRAVAQSADSAGLEVYVHDPSGAALVGAKVHVEQQETHITRDGITGKNGEYRFTDIPAGTYVLTTQNPGFSEVVESGITLTVGQAATLNVDMKVANASEEVHVDAETLVVDTNRSTIGQTISSVEIDNLPSNGRNFIDFALTVPGVTSQASSGQGSGLSFNGQRSRSNNIMVDGVENNGQLNGTVRQTLSLDAIAQFQVMTAQFLPEYGNSGGGMVNLITKSGTSTYRGDAYYFARNTVLDAVPYCFGANPCNRGSLVQNDYGATFGGPVPGKLFHGKTFFFASTEYLGINQFENSSITAANALSIDATLNGTAHPFTGSPITSVTLGNVPDVTAQTLASFRLDHTLGPKDNLMFRFLYAHYIEANPTIDSNDGALSDFSNYGFDRLQAFSFMGYETHVFSPTLLNEFHFQYSPQYLTQYPNSYGPSAYISGVAQIGQNVGFPSVLNESHYEWIEALSKSKGTHLFKAGADILLVRDYNYYPNEAGGLFDFGALSDFTNGTPYAFTQEFSDNNTLHAPDVITGYYIEDQWKVKPRLSFNYGVRYDLDYQPQGYNLNANDPFQAPLPKGIPRDYNNISPRFGFAYSLNKKSSTVVRGGWGMFYDKIFLIVARDALLTRFTMTESTTSNLLAGGAPSSVAQLNAQYAAGPFTNISVYPTTTPGGYTPPKPSIYAVGNKMPIPYAMQADLFVDQSLSSNWSIELGYLNTAGVHQLKAANINLPPPVILTASNAVSGTPNFQQLGRPYYSAVRINPAYHDITEYSSTGHSVANSFTGAVIHRASRDLTLRSSWTWSKEIDDATDFTSGGEPSNPYYPHGERSLGTQDQRNRFVFSAVYNFPYTIRPGHNSALRWSFGGWRASSSSTVASGTPQNITIGSDSNGDGQDTDRPYTQGLNGLQGGYIIRRNAFRGARSQNVNVRVQKEFPFTSVYRLIISVESFNTFNHANFNSPYLIWGTTADPIGYTSLTGVPWGIPANTRGTNTSTFGVFDGAGAARDLQLGIRLFF
jgi:outer membrane receptor protein involved in Fe transport